MAERGEHLVWDGGNELEELVVRASDRA